MEALGPADPVRSARTAWWAGWVRVLSRGDPVPDPVLGPVASSSRPRS